MAALRGELAELTRTNSSLVVLVGALQTQVAELRGAVVPGAQLQAVPTAAPTAESLGAQLHAMQAEPAPAAPKRKPKITSKQARLAAPLGEANQNRGTVSDWARVSHA